ncbi:TIGR02757 family protein [Geotalea sp. SG265]|uniref:TIGR02757 family protein n=1 Tax=Geotalea sp. SG265 TaxID=2922867 RepID=UPI001FAF65E8|nr:TIGR02757 family protein [Geotalea sp. SG265]
MQLKPLLESLYANRSSVHLANDPLSFCHRYRDPADREIAGFIASAFAYGNVKIILKNLESIFGAMGPSPRRFVEEFEPAAALPLFARLKHRFNDGRDLCALLLACRTMIDDADSIGEYFLGCHDAAAEDITGSLILFTESILAMDFSPVFGSPTIPADSYFRFFFPSPASGSACKRLCMFLRWMVRPADGIDLGLWKGVSPSQLVIPVDAHIQRIGRFLNLTRRKQADWRMAREITAALKQLDPDDPVKYDFSLCHLGISEGCNGKDLARCLTCPIREVCSLPETAG